MPKWIGNRFGDVSPITPNSAVGSSIYSLFDQYYAEKQNGWAGRSPGLTATGGIISDYTSGTDVYRAHVFTSSGTFVVSALGDRPGAVEYVVVGGGGGAGSSATFDRSGGGGAGGFRTNVPGHPLAGASFTVTAGPTSYAVTIGGGGAGGSGTGPTVGGSTQNGSPSVFSSITSTAGGGGGSGHGTTAIDEDGAPGGSGGGAGYLGPGGGGSGNGNAGSGNTPPVSPSQGFGGGTGQGGGGGGATGAGGNGPDGAGGAGSSIAIETNVAKTYATGGSGGASTPASAGVTGTGDGGDAGFNSAGFAGGSGIVVVRYQIAEITATAKATGGNVSFYGGKTIHTFTSSGTFAVTDGPLSIEYVALGGGAGGGDAQGGSGGGGGAGAFVTGPETANDTTTYTVTVGSGGAGAAPPGSVQGNKGGDTSISGTGISVSALGGGGGLRDTSAYTDPVAEAPSMPYTDYASGGGYGGSGAGNRPAGPGGGYAGGSTGGGTAGFAGGGGGGAGGAGVNGVSSGSNVATGGHGGFGRQIPSTFRNPGSSLGFPGPTSPVPGNNPGGDTGGLYWFGGGGAGGVGAYPPGAPQTDLVNGKGGGPGAPADGWAGAGNGGEAYGPFATYPAQGTTGKSNSGAGGGGSGYTGAAPRQYFGSAGGSGIVLIAYTS